jgi:hypothetical protein
MKQKLISLLAFVGLCSPLAVFTDLYRPSSVLADPIETSDYKSLHSLGCLILRECTDDVVKIKTLGDIKAAIPGADYDWYEDEIADLLHAMEKIGIDVFIADEKYFPPNHRGVYTPNGNTMFLNREWMIEPHYLLRVMRHEGWHAAQDCMAGTINNNHVAVILHDGQVPNFWVETATNTYPSNVVPWESEAMYAATQNNMTTLALNACASQDRDMWEVFEPTPMTREWLVNEGWIYE